MSLSTINLTINVEDIDWDSGIATDCGAVEELIDRLSRYISNLDSDYVTVALTEVTIEDGG